MQTENKLCEAFDFNEYIQSNNIRACAEHVQNIGMYDYFSYDEAARSCMPCWNLDIMIDAGEGINTYGLNPEVITAEANKIHAQQMINEA